MTNTQTIAVNRLEKSPLNVRRASGGMGMDELKASVLAHGLLQNLVVTDAGDGRFLVIAGGRRLEAIRTLQAEGKLPEDFAVPCQVTSEERAIEMSLAENTVRLAMHPADQFEAFASLIEQGQISEDIALRFGVDKSLVLKRMKLARVAPQLLDEYRKEGMTLECLMAYAVVDDHRRQLKAFHSLQGWQKDDPAEIRAALTEKMIEAGSKLARFVGIDAYTAAGGPTRADLFSDEVYLEKPSLLHKLAEQKFESIRKQLEAEGWAWIEINPERDWDAINRCGRIQPRLINPPADLIELKTRLDALCENEHDEASESLHAQLQEVEEKLATYVGFDETQKMLAGCFLSIGQDGTPFIDKGLVKPEHRKALASLLNEDAEAPTIRKKDPQALPLALQRDLAACRLEIAQAEIAKKPVIALDLMIFTLASRSIARRPVECGPAIEIRQANPRLAQPSSKALEAAATALETGWMKKSSEGERFNAFLLLPQETKLSLLAYCVALALQPKLGPANAKDATAYDLALSLTGADVSAKWRPGKDNFLGRISREQLLSVARETLGEPWAQSRFGMKKVQIAEQLDRAFAQPEKGGRTAKQASALMRWLPAGMGFHVGQSTTEKPSKPCKAA